MTADGTGEVSRAGEPILRLPDVHTHYGPLHVLKGVSYEIREGEIVSLLGGNASGKSTTMKTVLGLVRAERGTDQLPRRADPRAAHERDRQARHRAGARGPARLPAHDRAREPRDGALHAPRASRDGKPSSTGCSACSRILKERREPARRHHVGRRAADARDRPRADDAARSCSAWTSRRWGWPRDYVEQVFDIIQAINEQGTTIFVVEQNVNMALSHRAPRLRAPDGRGRPGGHRRRAAREPPHPEGLSRHRLGLRE